MSKNYDIVIVGAGPGGYVAAIRAAQLGLKTLVIEKEHFGGVCCNWGCIPAKALLRCSEVMHLIKESDKFGISVPSSSVDLSKMVSYSRSVADKMASGVGYLLKKNKVEILLGTAKLLGKGQLSVVLNEGGETKISGKHIIVATGARARDLPTLKADGDRIWNAKDAMSPKEKQPPKKLLVVGSGAIGMEFASFYNDIGSSVTVLELSDRILPAEDEEISALAKKSFVSQGIAIHTGSTVKSHKITAQGVDVVISTPKGEVKETFDRIILAVGIVGNVENIGLENTKVKVDRTHIQVNEWLETDEPSLYAIGDIVGPPWLAHKASHEAVICVEKIAGVEGVHPLNAKRVPGCTYCRPQIASVGYTEAQAKEAGYAVKVGRFPFLANGKATALGDNEGLVKTIFDSKTGELLGAHMVGPEVTELIQGFAIAQTLETTEAELMHTIFPHPTLSETMHEATLDAYGKVIHF